MKTPKYVVTGWADPDLSDERIDIVCRSLQDVRDAKRELHDALDKWINPYGSVFVPATVRVFTVGDER